MSDVAIWFDDEGAEERALVGGKGANLGRLVSAGFPVPRGFTVSTAAYADFMKGAGIQDEVTKILGDLNYDDATNVGQGASQIRELILGREMPKSVETEILAAYAKLGEGDVRCAVRSSGTAEDMAEASFAGMHDTYLDILGPDAVLEAVRRCWSSLWTDRAVTYRQNLGFDHSVALLAVVVQTMVESEVSGVMFTANPMNARVDEFVINASWGLGEAVVSGQVQPDEYYISRRTLRCKRSNIATKEIRIVRDSKSGTVTENVPNELKDRAALTDEQASELGGLGRRVMEYYDGFPQDIEWAFADGEFFLLQSRDVTGVEFTWDEDIDESFQVDPEQNDDILWTNQWAAEFWSGAITPLHYSVRARDFEFSNRRFRTYLGFDDIVGMRLFKYRRGTNYFNGEVDATHYAYTVPPALRKDTLGMVHPSRHEEVINRPFSLVKLAKALIRARTLDYGHGIYSYLDVSYGFIEDTREEPVGEWDWNAWGRRDGFSVEQIAQMSDATLTQYVEARMHITEVFNEVLWPGFFGTAPFSLAALTWLLENWYDGHDEEDQYIFQDLISGLPKRTYMAKESIWMFELGAMLRDSETLTNVHRLYQGAEFFKELENHEEGRAWLEEYARFLEEFGHRGHADRDMYYDRRMENPDIDYAAFKAILQSDGSASFEDMEEKLVEKRKAATEKVVQAMVKQPLGSLKAEIFKWCLSYVHSFLVLRDDERWGFDKMTQAKKRSFQEVGRRCVERGLLEGDDDFYFLSVKELMGVFHGNGESPRLIKAKIESRRTVFLRYLARQEVAPMYLMGHDVLVEDRDDNGLIGTGTAKGTVTGRARVVPNLELIGTVEKDDILICNSTDPGWASVFLTISGLVIEVGGVLAHGSCLSREYGLPAVSLYNAMNLIPDGATITVNGDTGEVIVHDEEPVDELTAVAGD